MQNSGKPRPSAFTSSFRPLGTILLVVLILQVLGLTLFHAWHDREAEVDQRAFPFVMSEQFRYGPHDGVLWPSVHFLSDTTTHALYVFPVRDQVVLTALNERWSIEHEERFPNNTAWHALTYVDANGDGLDELVFPLFFPAEAANHNSAVAPDSVWLCMKGAGRPMVVFDRFYANQLQRQAHLAPDEKLRQLHMQVAMMLDRQEPADTEDCFVVNMVEAFTTTYRRSVRVYRKGEVPVLTGETPTAMIPGPGIWLADENGQPVYTFGGTSPSNGLRFAVSPEEQAGQAPETLEDSRAAFMQIDEQGHLRWVRQLPRAGGVSDLFPDADTPGRLIGIHGRTSFIRPDQIGSVIYDLDAWTGEVIDSSDYIGARFTRFIGQTAASSGYIGLLHNVGGDIWLVGQEFRDVHHLPIQNIATWPDGIPLVRTRSGSFIFPLLFGDRTSLLYDFRGNEVGRFTGTASQLPIPVTSGNDTWDVLNVEREGSWHILEAEQNPFRLWWLWPYRWLVLFLVFPHVTIAGAFFFGRYRSERARSRLELHEAYQRLDARFKIRTEELAQVNQSLEGQMEERRRVEQELRQHREHLEAIFHSVYDGIVTVDDAGVVTSANTAFASIFQMKTDDVVGHRFSEIFTDGGEELDRFVDVARRDRSSLGEMQVELQTSRKEGRMLKVNAVPLTGRWVAFPEIMIMFRDITRLYSLERQVEDRYRFHNIIGHSPKMQRLYDLLEDAARSDSTALIYGESGTGKELVAAALHYNSSRSSGPFVKVNCAALSENLLESELFGHVRGAFTGANRDRIGRFEHAHGGTLFLDEIGEISPSVQVKLLRVLQEKEIERVGDNTPIKVDVRIVAATNQDLERAIREERFRNDLYYRLNVLRIDLPPLREHKDDIPLLVDHILVRIADRTGKPAPRVGEEGMELLLAHDWPGNVRELENYLERAAIVCRGTEIQPSHFPVELRERPRRRLEEVNGKNGPGTASEAPSVVNHPTAPNAGERKSILDTLELTDWNIAKAARQLGISRNTLYRKIQNFEIQRPR